MSEKTLPDPLASSDLPSSAHAVPLFRTEPATAQTKVPRSAIRWLKMAGAGSRQFAGVLSRRRAVDSVVIGCLLTLLVISFDAAGWLQKFEFFLFDSRAQHFQFFLPQPSDKLVHLDIDDGALEAIAAVESSWPWPRSVLAEMVDEMTLAQPKVVGLDILFTEPQKLGWVPPSPGKAQKVGDAVRGDFTPVDHDALFGAALAKLGCALVPVSLPFERHARLTDFQIALRAEIARDLSAPAPKIAERLAARPEFKNFPHLGEEVAREYVAAWRHEVAIAIRRELQQATMDRGAVKKKLLKLDRADLLLESAFDELFDEARSTAYMTQFSRPIPAGLPALFTSNLHGVPVPPLAAAATYSANVEFPPFRDGVVRAVPLFVKSDDRMYPQMGLAMVCAQLDIDIGKIRTTPTTIVLPLPDGREMVVPHRSYRSTEVGGEITTFIDIPWWGTEKWAYMYDQPNHALPANHMSIVALWDAVLTKRKIRKNAEEADDALIAVLSVIDGPAAEAYAAKRPPSEDINTRRATYERSLPDAKGMAELVESEKPEERDEISKRFLASYETLPGLMEEFSNLEQRLRESRIDMRRKLGGKAVFVGWTATGAAADFVPTSIHARCPGVVLHGAIFNGMMTGELWRTMPDWVTYAVTAFLGLLMTAGAAFFTPARAFGLAMLLIAGYAFANGLLLFDYGNVIVGAAGPLLCIVGVSQGCTLVRLIIERYQRSRIEGRFRSYVDPALVDYVVEHPDQIKLEGQVREMTVCFTDLGNFTPLTVQLKEATVPLLNRIFGAMVPEIRKNHGYVNKFLGDGIMFFFGAPRENANHARDAIRAVLDVQHAMQAINVELAARGLPSITLRAGVNTGNMVVGDAGSEKASDYTVLGDDVNLASRMESANKQLGTTMLVAARTVELATGESGALLRPVGEICVVGRDEPVNAYEIICRQADATELQRGLVEMTRTMVEAFREKRLDDCLKAAARLDEIFEPSKLTKLYRSRCEYFLGEGSAEVFTCAITLAEK
jgi:class 3 adenylate cyclase/CHASE2 domain-containing sensor protein